MDKTNIFFLAVAAGVGWWMYNEYQKQKEAQALQFTERDMRLQASPANYWEQMQTGYI